MSVTGYTKLFASIVTSTVWLEADHVRLLWITMLALSDKNGVVEGSVPGMAKMAGIEVEECREALARLMAPDKDSRTQDHEGRRIDPVDGGWQLLNHSKYRAKLSAEERREYDKKRKANDRARHKMSANVPDMSAVSAHTEAEAHTEATPTEIKNEDQVQRADARASHKVLVKLAHGVIRATEGSDAALSDLGEGLKLAAAKAGIAYDAGAIQRALDSALSRKPTRAARPTGRG